MIQEFEKEILDNLGSLQSEFERFLNIEPFRILEENIIYSN